VEHTADKQTDEADPSSSRQWGQGPGYGSQARQAPQNPFQSSTDDAVERDARRQARRQALWLMGLSSVVAIALLAGAWVLLSRYL
jgi:hypothetical protein